MTEAEKLILNNQVMIMCELDTLLLLSTAKTTKDIIPSSMISEMHDKMISASNYTLEVLEKDRVKQLAAVVE